MPKKIVITLLFLCSVLINCPISFGGESDTTPLLTINGEELRQDDFFVWWQHWKEDDSVFADSLDNFLDWSLEVQEATRMELYTENSFKHKIDVFLKARTLGMLRYDEVESKINIKDSELKKIYKKRYTPIWNIRILQLSSKDAAEVLRSTLLQQGDGTLTADAIDTVLLNSKISVHSTERSYRQTNLPAIFKDPLAGMIAGELSPPIQINNVFLLLFLEEINDGNGEDYLQQKNKISEAYRRELQNRYTAQLVGRLKTKYHVVIDELLLAELDPLHPNEDYLDKVLIKTDVQSANVAFFLKHYNNNIKFRERANLSKSDFIAMKYSIVNTIIAQNLTTWESLARHYEKKEPFKDTYEFYRQNRMIVALKERIVDKDLSTSAEDAQQYYEQNIADYSKNERAVVDVFENDYLLMRKIWMETITGGNFDTIIKKYKLAADPKEAVISGAGDDTLWQAVKGLEQGAISSLSKHGTEGTLVRLVRRIDAETIPFAKVKDSLVKKITFEKRRKSYTAFLAELKRHANISINKPLWQQILKNYRETDE